MDLKVFSPNNNIIEVVKQVFAAEGISMLFAIDWVDLSNPDSVDFGKEFVSLFMLDAASAASQGLIQTTTRLMTAGAHPRSMVFVLNGCEKLTSAELVLVEEDVASSLQEIIRPTIIPLSTRAYTLYDTLNKDPDNSLFQAQADLILTTSISRSQGIASGDSNHSDLLYELSNVHTLMNILKELSESPSVSRRREPGKISVVGVNLSPELTAFLGRNGCNVQLALGLEQTELLATHEDCVLIQVDDRIASQTISFAQNTKANVVFIYDQYPYQPSLGFLEELVKTGRPCVRMDPRALSYLIGESHLDDGQADSRLVLVDSTGYPIPKKQDLQWQDILCCSSGAKRLISMIQRRESVAPNL
jgi:hypothetical protein